MKQDTDTKEVKLLLFIYICATLLLFLFLLVVPDIIRYYMCDVETQGMIVERVECDLASPVPLYNYTVKFTDENAFNSVAYINASHLKYDRGEIVEILYQSNNRSIVKFKNFLVNTTHE